MIYYFDEKSGFAVKNPKVRAHIARLSGVESDFEATASHGQTEVYSKDQDESFSFSWVGIRCSKKDRLIGAVVTCKEARRRYFFALEVTAHEYGKTLVGNPDRLKSFRDQIAQFLSQLPSHKKEEQASASSPTQKLAVHKNKFIVLDDSQQSAMESLPKTGGVLIFGRAGSGKTVAVIEICKQFAAMRLPTLFVAPTERLAEEVNGEFSRDPRGDAKRADAISYDDFLRQMSGRFRNLHLLNDGNLPEVNWPFFEGWCREHIKRNPKKSDISDWTALWHEFCHVIMQPDWSRPERCCLSVEEYVGLGDKQSTFSKDERKGLYERFFAPFFKKVSDENAFYFPVYVAYRLYNALCINGLPDADKAAVVIDEIQKYHPWQVACLLHLVEGGVHGRFVMCGDANQGVESQTLRVAGPIRGYLSHHGVKELPICHLSRNHRNSIQVAGVVGRITRIEDELLGALERNTYVAARQQAESQEQGHVEFTGFTRELRDAIAADANAYIVVPNEEWQEIAAEFWPTRQIATLSEFSGMSAETIIMVGFTEKYKTTLDVIDKEWGSRLFDEEPLPFARPSELRPDSVIKRECLQAFSTAAARATIRLIMVGEPHRLVEKIIRGNAPQVAEARASMPEKRPSSLQEWFLRAKTDCASGLQSQATRTLTDETLWGAEKVAKITALMRELPVLDDNFFAEAETVLFPKKIPAAEAAQQNSGANTPPPPPKDYSRRKNQKSSQQNIRKAGPSTATPLVFRLPEPECPDLVRNILEQCQQHGISFEEYLWAEAPGCSMLQRIGKNRVLSDGMIKSTLNSEYLIPLLFSLHKKTIELLGGYWKELWEALNLNLSEQLTRDTIFRAAENSMSALTISISLERPKAVRLLLDLGAQVDPESDNTPLCVAATFGNIDIGEMLLACGAGWNKRSPIPFMCAVFHDNAAFVELLLWHNFNTTLNFTPSPGFMPLILSEMVPKIEEAKEALGKVSEHNPLTALEYCKLVRKNEIERVIIQHADARRDLAVFVEKLLSDFDAPRLVERCSNSKYSGFFATLLSVEVEHNGHSRTLRAFLAENPEHLKKLVSCYLNGMPYTPAKEEKMDFSLLNIPRTEMLDRICNVQEFLKQNRTRFEDPEVVALYPLHAAVLFNNPECIEQIIALDGDANLGMPRTDSEYHQYTALSLAAKMHNSAMVTLLINAGAHVDPQVPERFKPLGLVISKALKDPEAINVIIVLIKAGCIFEKFHTDLIFISAIFCERLDLLRALAKRKINFNECIEIQLCDYQMLFESRSRGPAGKHFLERHGLQPVQGSDPEGIVRITPLQLAQAIGKPLVAAELKKIIGKNTDSVSGQTVGFFSSQAAPPRGVAPSEGAAAQP